MFGLAGRSNSSSSRRRPESPGAKTAARRPFSYLAADHLSSVSSSSGYMSGGKNPGRRNQVASSPRMGANLSAASPPPPPPADHRRALGQLGAPSEPLVPVMIDDEGSLVMTAADANNNVGARTLIRAGDIDLDDDDDDDDGDDDDFGAGFSPQSRNYRAATSGRLARQQHHLAAQQLGCRHVGDCAPPPPRFPSSSGGRPGARHWRAEAPAPTNAQELVYQQPADAQLISANLRYLREQHDHQQQQAAELVAYAYQQQKHQSQDFAFSQFQPVELAQLAVLHHHQQQQQHQRRQDTMQPPVSRASSARRPQATSGGQQLRSPAKRPHPANFAAYAQHQFADAGERSSSALSRTSGRQSSAKPEPSSLGCCGRLWKLLLFACNLLFWCTGLALGAWGILALVEDHKYNLSQLLVFEAGGRTSLFQLLAWSFITLGAATTLVGFCGCSALLKNNRWILGLYIFLVLAIFALDLATGLLAIIFQERLVANVRLRLGDKLRNEYGNQASFTAAIDYTRFECCGLESHADYERSLWRLQRLGGVEAIVARTCCHLRNTFDDQAHVNPRPVNESMCQSADVRFHQSYRYRKGCLDELERLIRHKIWTFTVGCGAVGAVILLSLVFATCFCRAIPSQRSRKSSRASDSAAANHVAKSASGLSLDQHQRHYR